MPSVQLVGSVRSVIAPSGGGSPLKGDLLTIVGVALLGPSEVLEASAGVENEVRQTFFLKRLLIVVPLMIPDIRVLTRIGVCSTYDMFFCYFEKDILKLLQMQQMLPPKCIIIRTDSDIM